MEVMVGTDGHIDVSDISYLTDTASVSSSGKSNPCESSSSHTHWDTISLHSGSYEVEGSTKRLIEQHEQARSKYDKLK